jgi:hypothetical protein
VPFLLSCLPNNTDWIFAAMTFHFLILHMFPKFWGLLFSAVQCVYYFWQNMSWATFRAIVSQTNQVTLYVEALNSGTSAPKYFRTKLKFQPKKLLAESTLTCAHVGRYVHCQEGPLVHKTIKGIYKYLRNVCIRFHNFTYRHTSLLDLAHSRGLKLNRMS